MELILKCFDKITVRKNKNNSKNHIFFVGLCFQYRLWPLGVTIYLPDSVQRQSAAERGTFVPFLTFALFLTWQSSVWRVYTEEHDVHWSLITGTVGFLLKLRVKKEICKLHTHRMLIQTSSLSAIRSRVPVPSLTAGHLFSLYEDKRTDRQHRVKLIHKIYFKNT